MSNVILILIMDPVDLKTRQIALFFNVSCCVKERLYKTNFIFLPLSKNFVSQKSFDNIIKPINAQALFNRKNPLPNSFFHCFKQLASNNEMNPANFYIKKIINLAKSSNNTEDQKLTPIKIG